MIKQNKIMKYFILINNNMMIQIYNNHNKKFIIIDIFLIQIIISLCNIIYIMKLMNNLKILNLKMIKMDNIIKKDNYYFDILYIIYAYFKSYLCQDI